MLRKGIIFQTIKSISKIFPTRFGLAGMSKKTYPTSLRGFGYAFNEDGQMRQIDKETGKAGTQPFKFDISSDQRENQYHYEAIGEVITDHVYKLLDEKGLHRLYFPENVPKEKACFIFSTQKELKNPKKLLILIHGSGVVRAGQWARSLIINDSLKAGTVIPYIDKAMELGYEVLITNTNLNQINGQDIEGSETPIKHAETVWEKFVVPSNPESIAIVAHSYGGVIAVELANQNPEYFEDKVFAVGFTDSVHYSRVPKPLQNVGRNWITSSQPLDTPLKSSTHDVPCFSAGHLRHEYTSYSCMNALFKFFEGRYKEFAGENQESKKQKTDL